MELQELMYIINHVKKVYMDTFVECDPDMVDAFVVLPHRRGST